MEYKEVDPGSIYDDNYFQYELIEIQYDDKIIEGWQLTALEDLKKYKCDSVYRGYPVISLNGTFALTTIEEADVSEMDTSNVITMEKVFDYAVDIQHLDLSNWNIDKVRNFNQAFAECFELRELKLPKAHIVQCTAEKMFINCRKLRQIDMSNLEIMDLISSQRIFDKCYNVESIDLRNINSTFKYDLRLATWFKQNKKLKVIIVQNKNMADLVANMINLGTDIERIAIVQEVNSLDNIVDKLLCKLHLLSKSNTVMVVYTK